MIIYAASRAKYPQVTYFDPDLGQDVTVTDRLYRAQQVALDYPAVTWTLADLWPTGNAEWPAVSMTEQGDQALLDALNADPLYSVLGAYDTLPQPDRLMLHSPKNGQAYTGGADLFLSARIRLDGNASPVVLYFRCATTRDGLNVRIGNGRAQIRRGTRLLSQKTLVTRPNTRYSLRIMAEGHNIRVKVNALKLSALGAATGGRIIAHAEGTSKIRAIRSSGRQQAGYTYNLE